MFPRDIQLAHKRIMEDLDRALGVIRAGQEGVEERMRELVKVPHPLTEEKPLCCRLVVTYDGQWRGAVIYPDGEVEGEGWTVAQVLERLRKEIRNG